MRIRLKISCMCFMLFVGMGYVFGQSQQYTGLVRDASNGEVIPNVNVKNVETGAGTSANELGEFSLEAVVGTKLEFSAIGYKHKVITLSKNKTLEVFLDPQSSALNEVVVIAYGSAQRKNLTGSVSTLSKNSIARQQVSSVTKALEGTVPGLQLASKSGQPGEDATIQMRGMGSINANSGALIVVDGTPYPSGLSSINPNDIESMVISKDATSNSLYGSRAANGVILITTKKGTSGKTNVSFQARVGQNSQGIPGMDLVRDPAQYYEFAWQAIYNKALDQPGATDVSARQYATDNLMPRLNNYMNYSIPEGSTLIDPGTGKLNRDAKLLYHDDWRDELIKPSLRQEYNLTISGANQKTDYYISLGYLNDPSYVLKSEFNRYSARFNINTQVNNWLKTGFGGAYSRRHSNKPNYSGGTVSTNAFVYMGLLAPIVPFYAYDLSGNIIRDEDGNKVLDKGTGQTLSPYGNTQRPFFSGNHPAIYFNKDLARTVYDNLSLRTFGEADLLKGLKFRVNFSMDNTYSNETQYGNNEDGPSDRDYNGEIYKRSYKQMVLNTNQILTYEKSWDDHHLDALAGHEFYYNSSEALAAKKNNMFAPGMPELDNAANMVSSGSNSYEEALEGFFTRLNYNYQEKYFLSGSYRADGTSKFKYDKWGHFWSVGGAWRMAEEPFIKNNLFWIDELKLRASYGTQGNQQVTSSNYPYTDLWNVANQQGQIGITQASIGNPNLTWETNRIVDAGIDFRFLDRIYGTVDYFYRKTTNLIWNRPMPASTGIGARLENVGKLANYGVEVELGVNILTQGAVFWSVNLNASHYKNELLELPSELGDGYITGNYYRKVGKDYYNLYMNEYAGVDPDNGNALLYKLDGNGNKVTTSVESEATKFEVGSAIPKVVGGVSTNVKYKGFDLSIITSYQIGGKITCPEYEYTTRPGRLDFNIHKDMLNAWTPQNRYTDVPKTYDGGANITANSTRYLFDASYFNLKNVTLSYDFPWKLTNRMHLSALQLFVSGENLWFKSAKQGLDPRVSLDGAGANSFGFPQTRTISVGINVNL